MEEQRIVSLGVLDQPMHCSQNVGLRRLAHGILLIVGQDNHVFSRVAEIAIEVCRHILDVVDAPSKLPPLAEVIDADQQCFSFTCTIRILEAISLWCALTESLLGFRWWWWGFEIALGVGVGIYGR